MKTRTAARMIGLISLLVLVLTLACGSTQVSGASVPPSTTVTWTGLGDRWEVDLHVVAPPPPPVSVGGYTAPVSKLEILMPWLGSVTVTSLAMLGVALVKRHKA